MNSIRGVPFQHVIVAELFDFPTFGEMPYCGQAGNDKAN
jgi:hypothetical protein